VDFKDGLINQRTREEFHRKMSNSEHAISKALHTKTIAVVGLSVNPERPSYDVANYLKSHGYHIVPINPTIEEALGEKSYKSLQDLPDQLKREIEVVDIFRRPEDIPPIVQQAIEIRRRYGQPAAIWMQLGIVNEAAAQAARNAGMDVIMDRCMKIEHGKRLGL
jgi:predicted CoA-binding protein